MSKIIRQVGPAFLEDFKDFFPEIDVLTNEDQSVDLLVFTGGADVSIDLYFNEDKDEMRNKIMVDKQRDDQDISAWKRIINRRVKPKKILGICRGSQFINVMLGGTLFPDLQHYGIAHGAVHEIKHMMKNVFSSISVTNSFHHQGIRTYGRNEMVSGESFKATVLAVHPKNDVPEISHWTPYRSHLNFDILGLQFHPEFYRNGFEQKNIIRDIIYEWVDGKELY